MEGAKSVGDRALIGIPVLIASGLGLAFSLIRFAILLGDDLKDPPGDWRPVALFALMIGSAAAIVVMACAVAGLVAGLLLKAAVRCLRRARRAAL